MLLFRTPAGCHRFSSTLPGCSSFALVAGGLRYASTTGYYLTAFQADTFSPYRCSIRSGIWFDGQFILDALDTLDTLCHLFRFGLLRLRSNCA